MYKEVANLCRFRSVFPPCPSPLIQHIIMSVELIVMVGHGLKVITLLKNERYRFTVTCSLVAIENKDMDTNSNPGVP